MTDPNEDDSPRPPANPFVTALSGIAIGLVVVGWTLATFIKNELANMRFVGGAGEALSHYASLTLWRSFATQAAILGVATGIGVIAYLAWRHSTRSDSSARSDPRAR